jgi:hypothetical protein
MVINAESFSLANANLTIRSDKKLMDLSPNREACNYPTDRTSAGFSG